jgi:hypothetical protein
VTADQPTTWNNYEEVARYLLESVGHLLGLKLERVEGSRHLSASPVHVGRSTPKA